MAVFRGCWEESRNPAGSQVAAGEGGGGQRKREEVEGQV